MTHLRQQSSPGADEVPWPITINFHPDIAVGGEAVIDLLVTHGTYRSQFETGTSSGGLTAFRGGDRWNWESRIFGSAYDEGHPSLRPKYGALNHRHDPVGGSRRFGSCHFRMAQHVRPRTSFCYPDSHLQPRDFAIDDVRRLVRLAEENQYALEPLDNYVEAHIHGPLMIVDDVEAIVLDPSFRATGVEEAARLLGCRVEWHEGFCLSFDRLADCKTFRGSEAADAIVRIAVDSAVTPAILGRARDRLIDYQTAKWVWHCIAKFGHA
nr:DUF3626 domain-containing protein [Aurantimonas endophytica]